MLQRCFARFYDSPAALTSPFHAENKPQHNASPLSVLWPNEICQGNGLASRVVCAIAFGNMPVTVIVTVAMAIIGRADILELVYGTALWATLDGSVAGNGQPDNDVGVSRAAGAANVLLVAVRLDSDRVLERAW